MFTRVSCQACQHKFTIPDAGKRHNCPNCQSPYLPEKSGGADNAPAQSKQAGINKTMLGETGPPIRFNCPRCKKTIEAPAADSGTRKPCPKCGDTVVVPAQAPAGAIQTAPPGSTVPSSQTASDARADRPTTAPSRSILFGGLLVAVVGLIGLWLLTCIVFLFIGSGERRVAAEALDKVETLQAKLHEAQDRLDRQHENREFDPKHAEFDKQATRFKKMAEEIAKLQEERDELKRRDKERQAELEIALAKLKAGTKLPPIPIQPGLGTVTLLLGDDAARSMFDKNGLPVATLLHQPSKKGFPLRTGPQQLPSGEYVVVPMKLKKGMAPMQVEPSMFTVQPGATVELALKLRLPEKK